MSWASPTVSSIILVLGILLLTISAWVAYRNERSSVAMILVAILGLGLHLSTAADSELHDWDEKYHALVAKNLAENPGHPVLYDNPVLPYYYTDWTRNYTWLHKPPVPLWLMAGSISVFGTTPFAVRLPSLILFLFGLLLIYKVGKYFKNEAVGLIAMWLMAVNGLINDLGAGRTNTDHYDLMFMVFILAGVYAGIRHSLKPNAGRAALVGVLVGVALLTKWLPGLIVLPVWVCVGVHHQVGWKTITSHLVLVVVILAAIVVPWQLYIFANFPMEASFQNVQNWRRALRGDVDHTGGYAYYLIKLVVNYSWMMIPALGFLIYNVVKEFSFRYAALLVWIAVPLVFFTLVKIKTQAYILPIAPALFVVLGLLVVRFRDYLQLNIKAVSIPVLVAIAAIAGWPGMERLKLFQPVAQEDFSHIRELAGSLTSKTVVVEEPQYIEVMFYSDAIAYRDTLTPEMITHLQLNGYTPVRRTGNQITPVQ